MAAVCMVEQLGELVVVVGRGETVAWREARARRADLEDWLEGRAARKAAACKVVVVGAARVGWWAGAVAMVVGVEGGAVVRAGSLGSAAAAKVTAAKLA